MPPSASEVEARGRVVAEALAWVGTPYHHRGTLKGIGVDCAQFPRLVYQACGLLPPFETGDYPPDWHLHRSEERYLARVAAFAREINGDPGPGDFALFRVGRCYAHGAIVTGWPAIVHAVVDLAVLPDTADSGRLCSRPRKFFTLW
jgi:cell wall-associated NlpC family hydrolase